MKHFQTEENQQKYLKIITTGYEDIAKISMTFPEEIIDKIFEYERYILMKEHLLMYKYVVKDVEEGHKIVLTDYDWYKQYYVKLTMFFIYSVHGDMLGLHNH